MLSFKDIFSDHGETANYHLSLDKYNSEEKEHSMPQHPWKNLAQVYIVEKFPKNTTEMGYCCSVPPILGAEEWSWELQQADIEFVHITRQKDLDNL